MTRVQLVCLGPLVEMVHKAQLDQLVIRDLQDLLAPQLSRTTWLSMMTQLRPNSLALTVLINLTAHGDCQQEPANT